jgi:predicted RNA-binding Zn-ribbon protein involved in translation (DUF1610 family)
MFNKKKKDKVKCNSCKTSISTSSNFCPTCGNPQFSEEEDLQELGMLGRSDISNRELNPFSNQNLGITDKLIGSIINNLVKNIGNEFKNLDPSMKKANVQTFPNGIKIRIGPPQKNQSSSPKSKRKSITESQIKKMNSLPRASAKTSIKRLSDKVVYELSTYGINSTDDIFVSKLESGYEVKAIGEKKVYVNTIPINLPLTRFILDKNKLSVEFNAKEESVF